MKSFIRWLALFAVLGASIIGVMALRVRFALPGWVELALVTLVVLLGVVAERRWLGRPTESVP